MDFIRFIFSLSLLLLLFFFYVYCFYADGILVFYAIVYNIHIQQWCETRYSGKKKICKAFSEAGTASVARNQSENW